jgi:hypothetical protein
MIRVLAIITIWFHILWTSFLVVGIVIASRYESYEKINFAMILITLGGWLIFRSCPVTIFENYLHGKYDKSKIYEGSCIQQYLKRVNIHLEHQTITILLVSILAISFFLHVR